MIYQTALLFAAFAQVSADYSFEGYFGASNTKYALRNYIPVPIHACSGDQVSITTCRTDGLSYNGDPYIRLLDVDGSSKGVEVSKASNNCNAYDDNFGAKITYTYTGESCRWFEAHMGCWGDDSCDGSWRVTQSGEAAAYYQSLSDLSFLINFSSETMHNSEDTTVRVCFRQSLHATTVRDDDAGEGGYLGNVRLSLIRNRDGIRVASNDNGDSYLNAEFLNFLPESSDAPCELYTLRVGCKDSKGCVAQVRTFVQNYIYVDKDMYDEVYTEEFDPADIPELFPNMEAFIDGNIVAGDKTEENRLIASSWDDLGDDVLDDWGAFFLYDVPNGKYYFPLLSPQNQENGVMSVQTFSFLGRTFTIRHGWATHAVFKMDITVDDNLDFKFGGYGNMGYDSSGSFTHLTQAYTVGAESKTMYYLKQEEEGDDQEVLFSYVVPRNQAENTAIAYDYYQNPADEDDTSFMTTELTQGALVYFAKTADAKSWVISDVMAALA